MHCRYGIREALGIASEEGLESMWERHRRLHLRLWEGLNELGLEPFVEKEQYRLVSVNTIKVQACPFNLPSALAIMSGIFTHERTCEKSERRVIKWVHLHNTCIFHRCTHVL